MPGLSWPSVGVSMGNRGDRGRSGSIAAARVPSTLAGSLSERGGSLALILHLLWLPMSRTLIGLGFMGLVICPFAWGLTAETNEAYFQAHVAPLLERHCVQCHNADRREGGLALVNEAMFRAGGESGEVVEPGQVDVSLLWHMVSGEPAEMPKGRPKLRPEALAAIRTWIEGGAAWPTGVTLQERSSADFDWWSWQPLKRPSVPPLPAAYAEQARTPIDHFILQRLHERGWSFSPPADRRTLARRLWFDLTGLPPDPAQLKAFLADTSPTAYEELVERLLASPQYGEQMARKWLDVVKYADTCGYDKDKLRPHAWPYRDYVIRSLNEDKRYDRFIQEQLAGDLLFPGTPDGILGLGFLAAGPWDFIGHVEVPETKVDGRIARHIDRDEMVSNTLNTFLSLTVQCARCHHHKFDPITQQHYYGLQAVFAAVDRAERPYDLDAQIEAQRAKWSEQQRRSKQQLASWEEAIKAAGGTRLVNLESQIVARKKQIEPIDKAAAFGFHSALVNQPETETWVQVDLGTPIEIQRVTLYPCHDEFAGLGAGFGFPVRFRIMASEDPQFPTASSYTLLDQTHSDFANPGLAPVEWKPLPTDPPATARAGGDPADPTNPTTHAEGQPGIEPGSKPSSGAVRAEPPTPVAAARSIRARYVRITATKLVERQRDYMLALAELAVHDASGQNVAQGRPVSSSSSIEAPVRWSRANLTDGLWAKPASLAAAQELAQATAERARLLAKLYTPERLQARTKLNEELREAETRLASLPPGRMVYAAATQFAAQGNFRPTGGVPRPIHVLHRGDVLQPREPALPGTVPLRADDVTAFDLPAEHPEGARRAALAHWITQTDHPLTWRSIVNRIWQSHFGRGLVETPNDFGRMGAEPSHPELLDWLAVEFRDGGQSFKQLHRLIVNSAVYRQSSSISSVHVAANTDPNAQPANESRLSEPSSSSARGASNPSPSGVDKQTPSGREAATMDADNRLLWRASRRRLTAEEVRDSILCASDRLSLRVGGPGYYLFALEKPEHSPHYEYHKFDPRDPNSHRRSVYRFIVRSQPDPYMTTLDCADSSQSTPRREETLTSLQALTLLNNPFSLTMATFFADRLRQEHPAMDEQIERAMWLVVARPPTNEERTALRVYAEQHGLENLCRVLFNLSEFIFVE